MQRFLNSQQSSPGACPLVLLPPTLYKRYSPSIAITFSKLAEYSEFTPLLFNPPKAFYSCCLLLLQHKAFSPSPTVTGIKSTSTILYFPRLYYHGYTSNRVIFLSFFSCYGDTINFYNTLLYHTPVYSALPLRSYSAPYPYPTLKSCAS